MYFTKNFLYTNLKQIYVKLRNETYFLSSVFVDYSYPQLVCYISAVYFEEKK